MHSWTGLRERDPQLGYLSAAAEAASAGTGAVVLVNGPIGIGKSALLDAFHAICERRDAYVLRARAVPVEQNFSFGVTRQLLEATLLGASPDLRDGWLRGSAGNALLALFGDAGAVDDDGTPALPHELLHGLNALIEQMSAQRPLVMLIDDLQWADASSVAWFDYLSRRVHRMRVLTVATTTDSTRSGLLSHAALLALPPLSLAGTRALVADRLGSAADGLATVCYRAAGGNPLFLTSLLSAVVGTHNEPVLAPPEDLDGVRPARLRDRLTVHMRAQPEQVRSCIMAIAILGERADAELVGRMAKLDAVDRTETLRNLTDLGLLAAPPGLRFTHPVIGDAVEVSMTATEREDGHRSAAILLHAAGHGAEDVAHHLLAGASLPVPWTDAVLREAAERAVARGAPRSAVRYLRRALLDCAPDGPARGRLLVDLALAERGFDPSASVRHMSQAMSLLTDSRQRAAALVQIAPTVLGCELLPAVDLLAETAADLASVTDGSIPDRQLGLRIEARLRYANMPDPMAAPGAARRLSGLGPDPVLDTAAQRELVAVLLHAAAGGLRVSAAEAARLGNRLLSNESSNPGHVHTVLPLVAHTLFAADALDDIEPWLAACHDRAARRDAPVELALIRAEQAAIVLGRGAVGLARRWAHEANELADLDWEETNAICTAALAAVAIETRDEALTRGLLARHHRERTGNFALAVLLRMLRGTAATASGDLDAALAHLAECGRQLDGIGWRNPALYPWRTWTALVHFRRGERSAAMGHAEEAHADAVAWGARAVLGRTLRLRAVFTEGPAGIRLLEEALAVLHTSANRLERGKTMMLLGQRLSAAGVPGGDELRRRGRGIGRSCGAWWLGDPASADGYPAASGRESHPLTNAEQRVVELVVRGHTNREIAGRLGVTSRAVEKHLTSSYRKLGVPGRGGLIDVLKEAR